MVETFSIGFTGTQEGMTVNQKETINYIFGHRNFNISEVHHGDCVGSDKDFHDIAQKWGFKIVLHPPIKPDKRAFCQGAEEEYPKKDYLVRNKSIVNNTDMLLATPATKDMKQRSGTWSTIRYAKKIKKRLIIIFPDGKTETTWA